MGSTSPLAGLSTWEARLLEHVTEHLEAEGDLLASYQELVETAQAPYASYLIDLIVEDETRHHRLFGELVNALRAPVERVPGAQVPTVTNATDARALLEATEKFLKAEQGDARDLKRLARIKGLRSMRGHSVWPLLVELMERDTKKHQTILRFIRTQLRRQLR
jgi:rubrerythrin